MKNVGSAKIARSYSESLFASLANDQVKTIVLENMVFVEEMLKKIELLKNVMVSPIISKLAKYKIVEAITTKYQLQPEFARMLAIMVKNNRFAIFTLIKEEFRKLFNESRGIKTVILKTARGLRVEQTDMLKAALEAKLAKLVEFQCKELPSIIGGVILEYDSLQYDYSILGKINRLEMEMRAAKL